MKRDDYFQPAQIHVAGRPHTCSGDDGEPQHHAERCSYTIPAGQAHLVLYTDTAPRRVMLRASEPCANRYWRKPTGPKG